MSHVSSAVEAVWFGFVGLFMRIRDRIYCNCSSVPVESKCASNVCSIVCCLHLCNGRFFLLLLSAGGKASISKAAQAVLNKLENRANNYFNTPATKKSKESTGQTTNGGRLQRTVGARKNKKVQKGECKTSHGPYSSHTPVIVPAVSFLLILLQRPSQIKNRLMTHRTKGKVCVCGRRKGKGLN